MQPKVKTSGMVQNWPQGAQETQKISSNFVPFVPFVAKK